MFIYNFLSWKNLTDTYLEIGQTSMMERFAKIIVDGFQLLTIFAKFSILDLSYGSDCASVKYNPKYKNYVT